MLEQNQKISIKSASSLILASPSTAFFLEGPPGCGKTNATKAYLEEAGYETTIVDCQSVAPEDAASLPSIDGGKLEFLSHKKWLPRPKMAIILDEFPKASIDVMNTFLPLIFGRPRRFQENSYSDDMIVVLTGNSAEFRAGDNMKPHVRNRVVELNIADPTVQDAHDVALMLGWDSRIITWINSDTAALISYDSEMVKLPDSETVDRYYGYDPRFPTRPYVSMRALETVSTMLTKFTENDIPFSDMAKAFAGAIGVRATTSLLKDLKKSKGFVNMSEIFLNPKTAKIPDEIYDQRLVALNCASKIDKKNANTIFDYIERTHPEIQMMFTMNLVRKKGENSGLDHNAHNPRWNKFCEKYL